MTNPNILTTGDAGAQNITPCMACIIIQLPRHGSCCDNWTVC